ncbi:MAG TPA: M23 family metallopeptidase [Prevotella sp.]
MKKQNLRLAVLGLSFIVTMLAFAPVHNRFTAAEQQQISIETPGLFARSNAFHIEFGSLSANEYSFPLPVGKATLMKNGNLEIVSQQGDAVKAMFGGVVRLSRKHPEFGHVIVVRHDNGLETVYGNNAQNLVKVGDRVKAGQTIAIIGSKEGRSFCDFAIMVNGGRINPETVIGIHSHQLRKQTLLCTKNGSRVEVRVVGKKEAATAAKSTGETAANTAEAAAKSNSNQLNLEELTEGEWAYPLPGAHVISPYGGRRRHAGVDLKTRPNDKIVAAFSGVVLQSCPYFGYGNCIRIKHDNGLETLYSHQSRNLVKAGEHVKAGQPIGLTGRTGRATTEHLHFEVRYKGRRINPALVFDHGSHALQKATLVLTGSGGVVSRKNR